MPNETFKKHVETWIELGNEEYFPPINILPIFKNHLQKGDLVGIGNTLETNESEYSLKIGLEYSEQGIKVLYIPVGDDVNKLVTRYKSLIQRYSGENLYLEDIESYRYESILDTIYDGRNGFDIVVIDELNLISADPEYIEYVKFIGRLKNFCKNENKTVIFTCKTRGSRKGEKVTEDTIKGGSQVVYLSDYFFQHYVEDQVEYIRTLKYKYRGLEYTGQVYEYDGDRHIVDISKYKEIKEEKITFKRRSKGSYNKRDFIYD